MEGLEALARQAGFTNAAPFLPEQLQVLPQVRDMCRENRCRRYGTCWTCPPYCGSLEECATQITQRRCGLLVCTTGELEDSFDYPGMKRTEERHKQAFQTLAAELEGQVKDLLPLGAGACTLCAECACPDEACRHPNQAHPSMEAYGLLVGDVCKLAGLPYYAGSQTVSYFSCYLYNE